MLGAEGVHNVIDNIVVVNAIGQPVDVEPIIFTLEVGLRVPELFLHEAASDGSFVVPEDGTKSRMCAPNSGNERAIVERQVLDSLKHQLWRDSRRDEKVQVRRWIGEGSHAAILWVYDVLNKRVIVWYCVLRRECRKPRVDRCGCDLYFRGSCSPDCTFCIRL